VFTATDVDHMLRGRRRLMDYSLWSLTRSLQWTAFVAAFMNFITSAIGVVHYGRFRSDPLESATIRFRSDNRPFSILHSITIYHSRWWESIPMGIGVITIPILVDSRSRSHSHVLFNSCPIPMELSWDSHSHWDSQSNAHLYSSPKVKLHRHSAA